MKSWVGALLAVMLLSGARAHAEGPARKKLLFFGVNAGEGFSPKQIGTIEGLILDDLQKDPRIEALGKSDIAQLLGQEQMKQAMGCDESSSCIAEIAGSAGAELSANASVGKLGSLIIVNMRILDSAKAKALGGAKRQVKTEEELPQAIDELVREALAVSRGEPVPEPQKPAESGSLVDDFKGLSFTVLPQAQLLYDASGLGSAFLVGGEVRMHWDQFFVAPRFFTSAGGNYPLEQNFGLEFGYLFEPETIIHLVSPNAAVPNIGGMKLRFALSTGPALNGWPKDADTNEYEFAWGARFGAVLQGSHLVLQLAIGSELEPTYSFKPVEVALGIGARF